MKDFIEAVKDIWYAVADVLVWVLAIVAVWFMIYGPTILFHWIDNM